MRLGATQPTMPASITADLLVTVLHLGFYVKSHWKNPSHINVKFRNIVLGAEKFRDREKSVLDFTCRVKQKT